MGVLMEHLGTTATSLALIGVVSAIAAKMVRDKKKGKCVGCDGGCGTCPNGHRASIRGME